MGVPGLWDIISKGFDKREPFDVFVAEFIKNNGRALRIAVDGYGWIVEILSSLGVQGANSHYVNHCVSIFISKIKLLLKLCISFVIVFDGKYKPDIKRDPEAQSRSSSRSASRASSYNDYQPGTAVNRKMVTYEGDYLLKYMEVVRLLDENPQQEVEDMLVETSDFGKIVREIKYQLKIWNITYINSPAEGEAECAFLQSIGVVDYVMSNDVDCLVFGASKMLRNFSRFIEDNPASARGSLHEEGSNWVTPVHLDRVKDVTGFDRWRMLFYALLSGSDYGSGIKNMGFKRAAAIALLGSSKMQLFKEKSKDEKVDDHIEVPDFSSNLKQIYTSSDFLLDEKQRLKKLEVFQEQLKYYLTHHPYKFFQKNLSKTTFINTVSKEGSLEGFPSDETILSFYHPIVNKTNIFAFINGMTNYTDVDTKFKPDDIDPNLIDLTIVSSAVHNLDSMVSKVKIRRVSGINDQLSYTMSENVYKFTPLSRKWKLEFIYNKFQDIDYFNWSSKRLQYPKFELLYGNLVRKNMFNNIGKNTTPRDWMIRELDQCYLIYLFKLNQNAKADELKKEIYIDRKKTMKYPTRRKNVEFCQNNSILYRIDLVRITYNKTQFFNESLSQESEQTSQYSKSSYIAIQSESDLENGVSTTSENNEDPQVGNRIRKVRSRRHPDLVSCWTPRDIVHHYLPQVVEAFEEHEKDCLFTKQLEGVEKRKPQTAKKTNSCIQKTKLDQFFKFTDRVNGKTIDDSELNLTIGVKKPFKRNKSLSRKGSKTSEGMHQITLFFKPAESNSNDKKDADHSNKNVNSEQQKYSSRQESSKKEDNSIIFLSQSSTKTSQKNDANTTLVKISDDEEDITIGVIPSNHILFFSKKESQKTTQVTRTEEDDENPELASILDGMNSGIQFSADIKSFGLANEDFPGEDSWVKSKLFDDPIDIPGESSTPAHISQIKEKPKQSDNIFAEKVSLETIERKSRKRIRKTNSNYSRELGWSEGEFTDEGFSSDMEEYEVLMERISPTKKQKKNDTLGFGVVETPVKHANVIIVDSEEDDKSTPMQSPNKKKKYYHTVTNSDVNEDVNDSLQIVGETSAITKKVEPPKFTKASLNEKATPILTPERKLKKTLSGSAILSKMMESDLSSDDN